MGDGTDELSLSPQQFNLLHFITGVIVVCGGLVGAFFGWGFFLSRL